jgi:nitroimidazol reductase NimA-like FMN-containing flavoprotein (pyridoxamine 5'-phosphate oxidase superfamily)
VYLAKALTMRIRELTARRYKQTLAHASIANLRCSRKDQPPIAPRYLVRELSDLYGFSAEGRRIEWMRANQKMCAEIDDIANHLEWTSMVLYGRYLEPPDKLPQADERDHARKLLECRSLRWQEAFASRQAPGDNFIPPFFHCVDLNSRTGYRAIADGGNAATVAPTRDSPRIT